MCAHTWVSCCRRRRPHRMKMGRFCCRCKLPHPTPRRGARGDSWKGEWRELEAVPAASREGSEKQASSGRCGKDGPFGNYLNDGSRSSWSEAGRERTLTPGRRQGSCVIFMVAVWPHRPPAPSSFSSVGNVVSGCQRGPFHFLWLREKYIYPE